VRGVGRSCEAYEDEVEIFFSEVQKIFKGLSAWTN
jgi:hypothetical protein